MVEELLLIFQREPRILCATTVEIIDQDQTGAQNHPVCRALLFQISGSTQE